MEPHVAEQCARMSGEVQCRAWLALWTREKSELMNSERVVTLVGESKMLQSVRASSNVRSWVSGNGGASRARTECSILLRCKRAQADTYATLCVCVSVRVCVCERERERQREGQTARARRRNALHFSGVSANTYRVCSVSQTNLFLQIDSPELSSLTPPH